MSAPRKKSRTTIGSPVNDLEDDEEQTCWDDIKGWGGKKLDATTMQGSINEELEPNVDQVIDNIKVEPAIFVEHVDSITQPTSTTT